MISRHGLHDLDRVLARRGLRRQHDRIGAFHDRVGDVADTSARVGIGVLDHGLHHLRGRDHDAIADARDCVHDLFLQAR